MREFHFDIIITIWLGEQKKGKQKLWLGSRRKENKSPPLPFGWILEGKVWQEIKEASIGPNNFNPSKWISRAQEEGRGNCLLSALTRTRIHVTGGYFVHNIQFNTSCIFSSSFHHPKNLEGRKVLSSLSFLLILLTSTNHDKWHSFLQETINGAIYASI